MPKRASHEPEFPPTSTVDLPPEAYDLEPEIVIDERPRICIAIDAALDDALRQDSTFSNQYLGRACGVSGTAIARWRKSAEPTRDQLYNLELAIGKRPGFISELAGYFEPANNKRPTTEYAIEHDARFSDTYRGVLLAVVKQAIAGTKEERRRQSEWRRKAGRS